jgi:hypothetical protein
MTSSTDTPTQDELREAARRVAVDAAPYPISNKDALIIADAALAIVMPELSRLRPSTPTTAGDVKVCPDGREFLRELAETMGVIDVCAEPSESIPIKEVMAKMLVAARAYRESLASPPDSAHGEGCSSSEKKAGDDADDMRVAVTDAITRARQVNWKNGGVLASDADEHIESLLRDIDRIRPHARSASVKLEYDVRVGAVIFRKGVKVQTVIDAAARAFDRQPPGAPTPPAHGEGELGALTSGHVKHMVDRFLGWKLPANFNPDNGIIFDPIANKGHQFESRREPVGTNLFDAGQAEAMVRYMIEGIADVPTSKIILERIRRNAAAALECTKSARTYSEMRRYVQQVIDGIDIELALSRAPSPPQEGEQANHAITLTGAELRDAVSMCAPDMSPEQLEDEMTIQFIKGGHSGTGHYCWHSEYPEEGSELLGSFQQPQAPFLPPPQQDGSGVVGEVAAALSRLHCAVKGLSKIEDGITLFEASPTKSDGAGAAWTELDRAQKDASAALR